MKTVCLIALLLVTLSMAVSSRNMAQNKLSIESKIKGVDAQAFLQSLRLKHIQEKKLAGSKVEVEEGELLEDYKVPELVEIPEESESVLIEMNRGPSEFLESRLNKNA